MKVSLYIPCFNVEKYIGACIEAVLKQTCPVDEILVIDDGSSDATVQIASGYNVKIIKHKINLGLAAARNTGIENSQFEFIASLDADCCPKPDWLEIIMKRFISNRIAGVSGRLRERYRESAADRWRSTHMRQEWGDKLIFNPLLLFGSNNVFRKTAIIQAGGYPKTKEYKTNNEDFYISRKLRSWGLMIIYEPQAVCYHQRKDSLMSIFKTYHRWFYLHRPKPESIAGLIKKYIANIKLAAGFIVFDLKRRNWLNVKTDILFFYYQCFFDINHFFMFLFKRGSEN